MLRPPADSKSPPATKSPLGRPATAWTCDERMELSPTPRPTGHHATPSHRAICRAATPATVVKEPPARTLPSGRVVSAATPLFMPSPRGDHFVPSHCATLLAPQLTAPVKSPP